MSILKELKHSFLKASKVVVDKTGDYSRIAKLSLDIRNYEADAEKLEIEAGKFVLDKMEHGSASLDLNDQKLTEIKNEVETLKNKQEACRKEIDELKSKGNEKNKDEARENGNEEEKKGD